ncbi:DUF6056 family protein [Butyrivibrio fibrisolvens]|uniref:DUF6056 family protein n=1 Tax=Butyrivibrio fibrisolvens TaxID=831 RepID=UPI00042160CB|nr:DUF6056 family protein [Butyrivibrio fibrisolvens]
MKKKNSIWIILCYIAFFFMVFGINSIIPFTGMDDLEFGIPDAQSHNLIDYLFLVWNRNSRRLFCEFGSWMTMRWNGKFVANVLNSLFMLGLIEGIRRIAKSFYKDNVDKHQTIDIVFALLAFGSINYLVIAYTCFWGSGAVNYLWSATAFVWCILCPIKIVLNAECSNIEKVISIVSAICVCFSEEHFTATAAIIVTCCFGATIVNKVNSKYMLIEAILTIVLTIISLQSPGFEQRSNSEYFYPGFDSLPIGIHVFRTYQWILNGILNESTCAMVFLIVAIGCYYYSRNKKIAMGIHSIAGILLGFKVISVFSTIPLLKQNWGGTNLLNIGLPMLSVDNPGWFWNNPDTEMISWDYLSHIVHFRIIIYSLFLLIIFLLLVDIARKNYKYKGIIYAFSLAMVVSLALMHFSDTIYASGSRTLFNFNIILILTAMLVMHASDIKGKYKCCIIFSITAINMLLACGDILNYLATRIL